MTDVNGLWTGSYVYPGELEPVPFDAEIRDLVGRVRQHSALPVAVGFGISCPEHVREVWSYADGAVVGSRLVLEIENYLGKPELVERVATLSRELIG